MSYAAADGRITLALTGESMITRAMRPFTEPRFLALRDLLHGADAAFTNGEMLFHNYDGSPAHRSATWMRSDPKHIADLQWLGFDLVSTANNHTGDYGETGLLTSLRNLTDAGVTHAGSGRNLAEAVAPAYLDTPAGRVALIAATTSGRQAYHAGEQRPDLQGRAGTNLLRWAAEWLVDDAAFGELKRVADANGWNQNPPPDWLRAYAFEKAAAEDVVYLFDRSMFPSSDDPASRYVRSNGFGRRSVMHASDIERNLRSIRDAKQMADWVIYSLHNHEDGGSWEVPSDHVIAFAHAAIDAGADVVVGHGPHRDRGIEIYNGKPIFYSLGNFIAENNTVEKLPQDALDQFGLGLTDSAVDLYDLRDTRSRAEGTSHSGLGPFGWTAVAMVSFDAGALSAIELHPVDLVPTAPRGQAGRPMLAEGEVRAAALDGFRSMSAPFGTAIDIADGVGRVTVRSSVGGSGVGG
jgi:poly-gamma-glutamate capsule biosynthesis protein CapA/YwtB (metallophosphatase superfamily)